MASPHRLLTHQRVVETYRRCSAPVQKRLGVTEVEGCAARHTLVARKVALAGQDVREMLGELPDAFRAGRNGGWSMAQMIVDRHGTVWTTEMPVVEMLCVLGIAAGLGRWTVPDRAMWCRLPAGIPYYTVADPVTLQ